MLHSNPNLFGKPSEAWDASYARKFLQISKDELKLFDNISEKSTPQQKISKDKISDPIIEEPSSPRFQKHENAVDQLYTPIETSNIKVAVVHTPDLPQKKRLELPLIAEKQSLDGIPLCRSRTIEVTSAIPEKKLSNSTPGVQTLEGISFNMSTEHHTFSKSDKLQLNTTYVVPTVLDDKTNNIEAISDDPCKIITKKRTFDKLTCELSNQSVLEEPSSQSVPKFGGLPVFSTNSIQKPVDLENFLSKKLKLLEKRFSPSKDFSLAPSSEESFKPKCSLKNDEFPKITTSLPGSDGSLASQVNASSPMEVYDKEIDCSKATSNTDGEKAAATFPYTQSPEKATSIQKELLCERLRESISQKKYSEEIPLKSNTSVFEEESFISQPFPCGQPPSNTQFSVLNRPETQPAIKCQVAESETEKNLVEKPNVPLDVFYEKCSGQVEVNDLVPVKDKTGGKRKRKSKGNKPSKKLLNAKSLVCIQYTDKQVQDMIEIIKNFQFVKKHCI